MRTFINIPLWTALTIVLPMIVGCDHGPVRIPIKGTVTYKGEPIAQGTVDFIPKDGAATREAAPIVNGTFATLPDHGLLAGDYQVSISALTIAAKPDPNTPPGEPKRSKELIPDEYNRESNLTIEVRGDGKREFEFHLK